MAYLIDRTQAFRLREVVAVVRVARRHARSRVVFRDNSLYETQTRPGTLQRYAAEAGRRRPGMAQE